MAPAGERLLRFGPALLAIAIPLIVALPLKFGRSDLSDRTILAYDDGLLQWDPPAHDKADPPAARRFGMLPTFVASLGGAFEKSKGLSQEELDRSDVLLLVHPEQPLPEEQLRRVREWVRGGGSLLLATSPQLYRRDPQEAVNALIEETGMSVGAAALKPAAEDWEQCCQPMAHPAAAGVSDWRNRFGLSVGASLETHWPARPILAGRFAFDAERLAWETPGSIDALPAGATYVPGARLGDVVLAAERRLGDGRIILLADTAPLSDDGNVAAYEFTGRLLDYLANRGDSPQAPWRQFLGLLAAVALAALLAWRPNAWRLSTVTALLAVAWIGCLALSHAATEVLPDGRRHTPNNLAYIDASHLEPYSDRAGDTFGLGNFMRTLMRNGYLPLMLPKVSEERLTRAGLFVSIAPARPFSESEREAVNKLLKQGGTFVCMVGAEESAASRELLKGFSLDVLPSRLGPSDRGAEPEPLGAFRQIFGGPPAAKKPDTADGKDAKPKPWVDYYVTFYAGWPVACERNAMKWVEWAGKTQEWPVVVSRPAENGQVVVIGDTFFAVNENLPPPSASGQPSENAVFWRWLLSRTTDITGGKPWDLPPKAADAGVKEQDQPLEPDEDE